MARKDKARARRYAKKTAAADQEASAKRQEQQDFLQQLLQGSALGFDIDHASAEEKSAILTAIIDAGGARHANLLADLYDEFQAQGALAKKDIGRRVTQHLNLSRENLTGNMVFGPVPDREYHEGFMRKAIDMAEMALRSDETPVGCVFVHNGEIIGRGINGTNATLNGTRHAEFVALAEIMSKHPQSILKETDLYVTVEPCIMCASALRQYGIRTVYFGCLNDRFGGTGGVMTVNQDPGIDPAFNVYGGLFREEAIMLLRRFYVQENEKAPDPKPKKNRELKTAILPVNAPVTRTQPPTAIARALAAAREAEALAEAAAKDAAMSADDVLVEDALVENSIT